MMLLKKSLLVLAFFAGTYSALAQNNEVKEIKVAQVKEDPAEFVQNYMLNVPAASKNTALSQEDYIKSRMTTKSSQKSESFGDGMLNWVKEKYATVMDVLPNQISNVMLYRFIDEWYGVKYRMGGTSKSGIDCSAFVQTLYQYVFGANLLRTACMQFEESRFIPNIKDLREGDLVFFRINTSRISHVGVYLKNNFFVHSASSKGVSIAKLTSDYWTKYFAGGGRILN